MRGLDPGIHESFRAIALSSVDGRNKCGHDGAVHVTLPSTTSKLR